MIVAAWWSGQVVNDVMLYLHSIKINPWMLFEVEVNFGQTRGVRMLHAVLLVWDYFFRLI